MYVWNSRALAAELRTGELAQRERVKYLIATLLLAMIPIPARVWGLDCLPNWVTPVEELIAALGTIAGVLICFSRNEKGDGRQFIDRFICLGWTTAIRVGVAFAAAQFILVDLARLSMGDASVIYKGLRMGMDQSIGILFEGVFFWRLWHRIGFVSNIPATNETAEPPFNPTAL
jgi:hypothetical protein